jgi:hypothetical protein
LYRSTSNSRLTMFTTRSKKTKKNFLHLCPSIQYLSAFMIISKSMKKLLLCILSPKNCQISFHELISRFSHDQIFAHKDFAFPKFFDYLKRYRARVGFKMTRKCSSTIQQSRNCKYFFHFLVSAGYITFHDTKYRIV